MQFINSDFVFVFVFFVNAYQCQKNLPFLKCVRSFKLTNQQNFVEKTFGGTELEDGVK